MRFRADACSAGWRRQALPSLHPRWSRLSQQRRRPLAWSVGNRDGKDGAWVGECGAWVVEAPGLPGAQAVAAPCKSPHRRGRLSGRPRHPRRVGTGASSSAASASHSSLLSVGRLHRSVGALALRAPEEDLPLRHDARFRASSSALLASSSGCPAAGRLTNNERRCRSRAAFPWQGGGAPLDYAA